MTRITTNPTMAALVSIALAFPLMLLYTTLALDIDALEQPLLSVLSNDGERPNALGWVFMVGSLLPLPVAFVLNLLPMVKRSGPDRRRALYPLNLIVGVIILFYLTQTWGELLTEAVLCRMGVPNCD